MCRIIKQVCWFLKQTCLLRTKSIKYFFKITVFHPVCTHLSYCVCSRVSSSNGNIWWKQNIHCILMLTVRHFWRVTINVNRGRGIQYNGNKWLEKKLHRKLITEPYEPTRVGICSFNDWWRTIPSKAYQCSYYVSKGRGAYKIWLTPPLFIEVQVSIHESE